MSQARVMVTPGSNDAAISATAAGEKDETIMSSCEHHDSRSRAGLCQHSEVRYDTTFATKEVVREASSLALGCFPKKQENRKVSEGTTNMEAQFPMV